MEAVQEKSAEIPQSPDLIMLSSEKGAHQVL